MRMSLEEYRKITAAPSPGGSNKYHAKKTTVFFERLGQDISFDSRAEARRARDLELLVKTGHLLTWIPQVSLLIPPASSDTGKTGKRHRVDFLAVKKNGEAVFIEEKGRDLDAGRSRRALAELAHGIRIHVNPDLWGVL